VTTQVLATEPIAPSSGHVLSRVGDPEGLLLAGPTAVEGPESLDAHRARLGPSPVLSGEAILSQIRASGLQGRGGGGFPLWRKLETALASPGDPLLVVNCSESEPASRKDWTICSYRPHTVLEGAAAMARVLRAREVVIHLHGDSVEPRAALRRALRERGSPADDPAWRLSCGPGGYVSGEASAVARFLHEGVALPLFSSAPLARRGPSGDPTVVSNAETAAHVASILRAGAERWRAAGTPSCPGPQLLTLSGAVVAQGSVVELTGSATIGAILRESGLEAPPHAVLMGGYAGTWIHGQLAWETPMEPASLSALGATRGCGLIGVLPHGACGIAETARIVDYLAAESAGQCGPCVHGLPVLARGLRALARGRGGRSALRHIHRTAAALPGSGACSHPDGVVRLVVSALEVFHDDVSRHRKGTPCRTAHHRPLFPLMAIGGHP
jgi:NADH:ubiquinone oxidoreductase subunit F (NADH-binding)